ncbi:MAG: hypothetical protein HC773_19870 [Scytonema sp. CRU_2_7]|nr:hypothetical protein [Scytonema sp. CRU_2_7]
MRVIMAVAENTATSAERVTFNEYRETNVNFYKTLRHAAKNYELAIHWKVNKKMSKSIQKADRNVYKEAAKYCEEIIKLDYPK